MSSKTLTDELRSVLLFHSLEAPQPNATVDRILNDTVGSVVALGAPTAPGVTAGPDTTAPTGPAKASRRLSVQHVVAASVVAILLLAVAGINSARNRDAGQTASRASRNQAHQPAPANGAAAASMVPPYAVDSSRAPYPRGGSRANASTTGGQPAYVGKLLDCSTIPGGHLIIGQSDDFTLGAGEQGYVYEFLCVGTNGQRSASEVQAFRQVGSALVYLRTLLAPSDGQHLDFMIGGLQSVRIQASDYGAPPGGVPGEVVAMSFDISDSGWGVSTAIVAEPCRRKDLTATVTPKPHAIAAWLLRLRNHTGTACALEGFAQVRAQRDGVTVGTAVPTLSGTSGGVTTAPVPPIIVLAPAATASAIIEQTPVPSGRPCLQSDHLAVSLAHGVFLGALPAELFVCGLEVHPVVGNATGSD
jgi:hypothetical protein